MMLSAAADPPHHEQLAGPGGPLRAVAGDTLIMNAGSGAGIPRIGEIVAVIGADGSPPYRVRWLAGEYESMIFPGPGARVRQGHGPERRPDAGDDGY